MSSAGIPNYSSNRQMRLSPRFIQLGIIVVLAILLPLFTFIAQQASKLRPKAGAAASLTIVPQTVNLSQGQVQTFSLNLNADTNLMSFVHVELTFDQAKLQLTDVAIPIFVTSRFQRQIQVTDKTTANSNGKITIALGLDPGAAAPTGTFELASLPFAVVSSASNDLTDITVADTQVLLVDANANPVSLTVPTQPAHLTLNEIVTASPQLTASPQPTPTTDDTVPPTVTIVSPVGGATVPRGSQVTISATASDNVAVSKVEFRENNKVICTDTTASYTCTWRVGGRPNTSYTLEARAYDAAGNVGSSQTSVISSN